MGCMNYLLAIKQLNEVSLSERKENERFLREGEERERFITSKARVWGVRREQMALV